MKTIVTGSISDLLYRCHIIQLAPVFEFLVVAFPVQQRFLSRPDHNKGKHVKTFCPVQPMLDLNEVDIADDPEKGIGASCSRKK